jgi:glycosyltransferase involved in cell wall biosynthesis
MKQKSLSLLFLFWGRKGGGAKYSYEISRELNKRDDVDLYLSVSNQCDLIDQFKNLKCPGLFIDTYISVPGFIKRWVFQRQWYLKQLTNYLKEHEIDVLIIGMDFFWGGIIYKAAQRAEVKTIYVVHEPKPHPNEPFFMGLLKRKTMQTLNTGADHLVALTDHVKEYLVERYGFDNSKISVIPHGIFSYYEARQTKQLPKEGPVTLLYFGAITYYKGLDILLKAYKILEDRNKNVKLEIWGEGSLDEYQKLISELNRVHIENRWIEESEVGEIFERSHICVLPYRELSQSGIVGAASKAALPIVACPADGLKEQMSKEQILFSNDFNPESLADAIEKFLNDPELYERRSQKLLDYSKKLEWSKIALDFKKIGDKLLKR